MYIPIHGIKKIVCLLKNLKIRYYRPQKLLLVYYKKKVDSNSLSVSKVKMLTKLIKITKMCKLF